MRCGKIKVKVKCSGTHRAIELLHTSGGQILKIDLLHDLHVHEGFGLADAIHFGKLLGEEL